MCSSHVSIGISIGQLKFNFNLPTGKSTVQFKAHIRYTDTDTEIQDTFNLFSNPKIHTQHNIQHEWYLFMRRLTRLSYYLSAHLWICPVNSSFSACILYLADTQIQIQVAVSVPTCR